MEGPLTCAESLLNAGVCCSEECQAPAGYAILCFTDDFDAVGTEHAVCADHIGTPGVMAVKPLVFDPAWLPGGAT